MSGSPRTDDYARLNPSAERWEWIAKCAEVETELNNRIKQLEAVVNDPHALWSNWLRGDVKLPEGIGDVRQYQERIQQLEEMYEGETVERAFMGELAVRENLYGDKPHTKERP